MASVSLTNSAGLHSSTPNLATQSLLETDIDELDSAFVEAAPLSNGVTLRTDALTSGSVRKQRALSCDDTIGFLHPEVRLLQENRALSSSLPLLSQLCRDPSLVQLLEAEDALAAPPGPRTPATAPRTTARTA